MIGSHDSYSYLDASSTAMNAINRFWRCQNKTVLEQYIAGVRLFDVRIKREINSTTGKSSWRTCHGYASFSKVFTTLKSICVYFTNTLKNCKVRIWLESGSDEDWEYFKSEVEPLIEKYPNLVQVVRKNPETVLLDRQPKIEYYACKMEKFSNYAKGIYTSPIKDWAKKNNPEITQEMIDDPDVVYFMDYCTNEF